MNSYFAILGRHPQISLQELDLIQPQNLRITKNNVAIFDCIHSEKINRLAGNIKWGKVVDQKGLEESLKDTQLLGIEDKYEGITLKKKYQIKRFKEVGLQHTDLEVKNEGKEIIVLGDQKRGVVGGYQNSELYEYIDFKKPSSGMEIGMMPSKLAHILINIAHGLNQKRNISDPVIYDPFCGFGTTNFVAQAYNIDSMGSDINITQAKINIKWRQDPTNKRKTDAKLLVYKHDVTHEFKKPFLDKVTAIVSEGWLGPIVRTKLPEIQIQEHQNKILNLYTSFLENCSHRWKHLDIVITVPIHLQAQHNTHLDKIKEKAESLGRNAHFLEETYSRPRQFVGRKILIANK